MAFLFAPGITLVARYFRKGAEGLGIGLFTGAFDLGGIMAIPGLAVLGQIAGWRLTFVSTGIIGLFMTVILIIFVPRDDVGKGIRVGISELRKILLNRWLLLVGLGCLSVQVGWNTIGSFMVFYLEDRFAVVPGIAGLAGSLFLVTALLASPISGRMYGRVGHPVRTLFIAGMISAIGLASTAFAPVLGAAISTLIVGAGAGVGFTTAYILAREVNESEPRYETLSVSWVNGISLFGGFWTPVLFSYAAVSLGYAAAWLVSGAVSVPLILPILTLRRTKKGAVVASSSSSAAGDR
jgi:DHA1 family inner membrane transport protein